MLEFLGDTLVGSWVSAGDRVRRGIEESRAVPEREMVSEGEEGRQGSPYRGRPRLAVAAFCTGNCTSFLPLSFLLSIFTLSFIMAGRLKWEKEIGAPRFDS